MKRLMHTITLCSLLTFTALAQITENTDSTLAKINKLESKIEALKLSTENDYKQKKLSTMWTVVSLNMIGADVLASYIPGTQDEVEKFAGGKENVKYFMLSGAIIYEVPISMIFLSRYLPYKVNRWTNVAAAALTALTVIGGGSTEPHYIFMATAETLTLSYIVWTALKWPDPEITKKHDIGLNINSQKNIYGLNYSYTF